MAIVTQQDTGGGNWFDVEDKDLNKRDLQTGEIIPKQSKPTVEKPGVERTSTAKSNSSLNNVPQGQTVQVDKKNSMQLLEEQKKIEEQRIAMLINQGRSLADPVVQLAQQRLAAIDSEQKAREAKLGEYQSGLAKEQERLTGLYNTRQTQLGDFYKVLQDRYSGYKPTQVAVNPAIALAQEAALGKAPSAAQSMLQSRANQIAQQQMAASQGRGGYNPALARAAMMAGSQAQQQANADIATLRAQEIAQARGELGTLSTQQSQLEQQARIADQNYLNQIAQQQIGAQEMMGQGLGQYLSANQGLMGLQGQAQELGQNQALAFLQARNQMQGAQMGALGQGVSQALGMQESTQERALRQYLAEKGIEQNYAQMQQAREQADRDFYTKLFGSVVGAGATVLASDERIKENVKDGSKKTQSFLDALKAKNYNYKGDKTNYTGIMAQDVEKAAPELVKEISGVKHIDTVKGFGQVLAALSQINNRLKALEA